MPAWTRTTLLQAIAPALCLLTIGTSAAAQDEQPSPRCAGAEYRQFDFWIGEWDVHNEAGDKLGSNSIRRIARGCGLLEDWVGATGGRGMSVNGYDAASGKWTQRWIGDGSTLWIEGGLQNGSMVLSGTGRRATPQGSVFDRITFTPLPDGRVLQLWEISPDGRSWQTSFRGYYRRRVP